MCWLFRLSQGYMGSWCMVMFVRVYSCLCYCFILVSFICLILGSHLTLSVVRRVMRQFFLRTYPLSNIIIIIAIFFQFDAEHYYNSCTMKSCCFAGDNDQFVLSGSDDFNLYMWKIPESNSRSEC